MAPLYDYECDDGHRDERFFHQADQAEPIFPCRLCGRPASKQLSMGHGLCYFEEGRERLIWNLGDQPVRIRSHEEHKRKMREAKVDFAHRGRGYPGQWV